MTSAADVAVETPIDRAELLGELEREVGVMVRRIRRLLGERARSVHPELQSSTYLMLSWLESRGPMRASAISDHFGIDKGAISRQAQHLIDLGLVDRTPDPDDGRATLLSASKAARERLAAVTEASRESLDEKLGDLPDGDLAQFVGLLGRYNAALDA
ncbi:MarR family transcriptional regulator [Nocardioides sp. YIM 152315]|uniref:MarR family winged helix-turn-helix transcriptional regulator n=1 Tax=Nocardioides sp. YIM 152315 TaxID=3031760 RepID=UPI0023DB1D48|nr:MarR family transcriptional regulator [Nocardioides sp. YIM 152315]MDF1605947.1 MarR family transcriptional regulator [Nocardioides sp. YIM 152315]